MLFIFTNGVQTAPSYGKIRLSAFAALLVDHASSKGQQARLIPTTLLKSRYMTMKIAMTLLSLFMLALVVMINAIDESRKVEIRARYQSCNVAPYTCAPPVVSFASLH